MARRCKTPENLFRMARKNAGLTIKDAAEALEISVSQIYNYERNERLPSIDVLIKISELYGVTTDYLLGINTKGLSEISYNRPDFCNFEMDINIIDFMGNIPVKYVSSEDSFESFGVLDQEYKRIRFPQKRVVLFKDIKQGELFYFMDKGKPLSVDEVFRKKTVCVFSFDLTNNISGDCKVIPKENIVVNNNGVYFHKKTYGVKWIAF